MKNETESIEQAIRLIKEQSEIDKLLICLNSYQLDADVLEKLGEACLEADQTDGALTFFEKAIREELPSDRLLQRFIQVAAVADQIERATQLCREVLAASPGSQKTAYYLSILQDAHPALFGDSGILSIAHNKLYSPTYKGPLINYLIDRFGYKKYLEIGCWRDDNLKIVNCAYRVGVDPNSGGNIRLSSDEFFALSEDTFDIILIDGLHHCEQVDRDIHNSLGRLRPNGTILVHDCNPTAEAHQTREQNCSTWNGDVWKALIHYRQRIDLDICTVNFDHGVGIIRVRPNSAPINLDKPYTELSWSDLVKNRQLWLRLSDFAELEAWL